MSSRLYRWRIKNCPLFKHFAQMGSGLPRWGFILPTFKFRPWWQCVLARCQVAVYSHLSMGPQGRNPLLCRSASVLHSRSARYNWDQPDTTGSCSDIARQTVRQLLGASCLKGRVVHSEFAEIQITLMQQRAFSFLMDDNQQNWFKRYREKEREMQWGCNNGENCKFCYSS